MQEIHLSADELIISLLNLDKERNLCVLDSCGVSNLGSHLLIAGIDPVEVLEINEKDAEKSLEILNRKFTQPNLASIFTISYNFGLKLNKISPRKKEFPSFPEPDIFLALFDCLIIHDYNTNKTFLTGNKSKFSEIEEILFNSKNSINPANAVNSTISSNFSRENYLLTIKKIQEFIRNGDTYQTNLTQQIRAILPEDLTPEQIFIYLRKNHPAPFASFLRRKNDGVISASPERFFKVQSQNNENTPLSTLHSPLISVSPIKGTRPRGENEIEDEKLQKELLNSEKDRAENVMIVDLLRNDIGRVSKFGSVKVEKLCDLEIHPTLFHLVSTVTGELNVNTKITDILRAAFPCGSITGAPKIRTMQIIDQLETADRGLSMGAIGYFIDHSTFNIQHLRTRSERSMINDKCSMDLSVAIRTMVIRNNEAIFNVGGGIVIDSDPGSEYEETLVKAKALLNAINGKIENFQ